MAKSRPRAKRKKYHHAEPTKELSWSKDKRVALLIIGGIFALILIITIIGIIVLKLTA